MPLALISADDIGPMVAHVIDARSAFLHKTLSVCGDKLTIREISTVLNKTLAPRKFYDKQV